MNNIGFQKLSLKLYNAYQLNPYKDGFMWKVYNFKTFILPDDEAI